MAKNVLGSSNTYTGDAGTTVFSINLAIGTINVDQIKVYLDGVLKTNITDYTIDAGISTVTFVSAPASGVTIDIRREQDDNALEVDYQDTQVVKEKNLDDSNKSLYYLIHELFDGWLGNRFKLRKDLDANNKKVVNLKDPENDQDAVTYKIAKGLIAAQPVANATEIYTFSFLGSQNTSDNLTYDLSALVPVAILQTNVHLNGVKQIPTDAYIVSGTDLVFSELIDDNDTIEVAVNLNTDVSQTPVAIPQSQVIDLIADLTLKVSTTHVQALHASDALSIATNTISLNKADGSSETVEIPIATRASLGIDTTDNVTFADLNVDAVDTTGIIKITNSSYRQIGINRGSTNLVGISANGTQGSTLQLEASDGGTTATILITKLGDTSGINNLDVSGYSKCGSYTVATVPSASTSGAGASIYVTDETGGAVLATSDDTNWRRSTDRAVVS